MPKHAPISAWPKHLRPREKLIEKGAENLTNKELLAILIRTGRVGKSALDISAEILEKIPIKKLLILDYTNLTKIKGISQGKACTLLAAFELVRRATDQADNSLPIIDSPQKAVDQLTDIRSKSKEHFVALYLNARNQLVHREITSIGTLNASLVHPREVFEPAVKLKVASLIVAHNHPSGDTTPSEEDKAVTQKLTKAGEILGITFIDHLIITKDDFVSMKEVELLKC